jgi:multidrug efflux system membrane fusion protein
MNCKGEKNARCHWLFRSTSAVWLGYLLVILGLLSACSGNSVSGTPPQLAVSEAVPVSVATVTQKAVPVQVRAIGTVEAHSTIAVKAQVEGVLTGVYFTEGQDVKKGALPLHDRSSPL